METPQPKPDLSALRIDRSKKFDDRPRSGWWKWAVALLVVGLGLAGYRYLQQEVASATKIKIGVTSLLTGSDASAELVATGYVVAQRKAEVASKGTGRLQYMPFEEGDRVKSGDIIGRLDNDDIAAALASVKASLRQAGVDTLQKGQEFRRRRTLVERGLGTEAQLEMSASQYNASLAALEAAQAAVKVAAVNLENTYIRAPFDGTILTKNADVGEMVAPFASSASSKGSVVTLADMESLEVEADVSESYIHKVRAGQPCEIILDAYPGVRFPGQVKKIVPTADRSRATVLTKISFGALDARILPEMSARVNFFTADSTQSPKTADTQSALAIPKEGVSKREGVSIVFQVVGERVFMKTVRAGRELGGVVEILDGLAVGDSVVLSPPGKMVDGQKVEITQ